MLMTHNPAKFRFQLSKTIAQKSEDINFCLSLKPGRTFVLLLLLMNGSSTHTLILMVNLPKAATYAL